MDRSIKAWAAAGLLAASLGAPGHGRKTLCAGFLPENTMRIPVGDVHAAGIPQDMFNRVLDRVERIYAPIVASKGGQLVVDRLWEDPTVNAYASQSGSEFHIAMFGGLARHEAITEDGFALVACHEIGHHIGGFPKSWDWATNEGAADYFATLKCLRNVLTSDPEADPTARAACAGSFSDPAALKRCRGGSMAGFSVTKLFTDLGQTPPPSFSSPDPSVVDVMDDSHPAAQCRLDTYFQGALCTKALSEELSDADPVPGACTRKQGFQSGLRPRCWYKPPADEPEAPKPAARLSLRDGDSFQKSLEALRGAWGDGA